MVLGFSQAEGEYSQVVKSCSRTGQAVKAPFWAVKNLDPGRG